jgi:hypothetical protein
MTDSSELTRKEEFLKMLKDKEQQKKFVENHLKIIYDIESKYLNQKTRNDAQKEIRQIILANLPKDIEKLKIINGEYKDNDT